MDDQSDNELGASSAQKALVMTVGPIGCVASIALMIAAPFALISLIGMGSFLLLSWPIIITGWVTEAPILNSIILIGAVVALHFFSRALFSFVVTYYMEQKADVGSPHDITDPADTLTDSPDLRFEEFASEATHLTDTTEEFAVRDLLNNSSSRLFDRGVFLIIVSTIVFCSLLSSLRFIQIPGTQDYFSLLGYLVLVVYPLVLALIAAVLKSIFFGGLTVFSAFLLSAIGFVWIIIAGFSYQENQAETLLKPFDVVMLAGLAFLSLSLLPVYTRWRARKYRNTAGIDLVRLLILRVFGAEDKAHQLFSEVERRWLNIGPVMTLVDSSSAAYDFQQTQKTCILLALIMPLVVLFLAPGSLTINIGLALIAIAIYPALLLGCLIYQLLSIRSDYSISPEGLELRIANQQARRLTTKFNRGRLYCYSNTWQPAIHTLVGWTNLVFMDLRGISAESHGCAYEIAYLFNTISLERVIFMIDGDTDSEFVKNLMQGIWRNNLRQGSLNASNSQAKVTLFRATESRNLGKDTFALLSLFAEIIAKSGDDATHDFKEQQKKTYWANILVWSTALVPLFGFAVQSSFGFNNSETNLGYMIAWAAVPYLLLSRRIRYCLFAYGQLRHVFQSGWFNWLFLLALGSWFLLIQLLAQVPVSLT